jgi:Ca2+-binding RTX toxin-like protein
MTAVKRAAVEELRRGGARTLIWILAIACTLAGPTLAGASPSSPTGGSQLPTCFGSPPTIVGTEGPDQLRGTPADDVVVTLGGVDTYDGTLGGADKICTGDGGDTVLAGAGNDEIDGGADSDTVYGGQGDDNLVGGEGPDLLAYFVNPVGVQVDLAAGTATGAGTDRLSGFEWVWGSAFGDVLEGDDGPNFFVPDVLQLLPAGSDDVIRGGAGFDLVMFEGAVRANLATGQATGEGNDRLTEIEGLFATRASTLVGNGARNFLFGGDEADVLDGAGRDHSLIGGAGNDRLSGGAGLDLIDGGGGNDAIDGGAGLGDVVTYLNSLAPIRASLASRRGRGDGSDTFAGLETIVGSQLADTLDGSGRADRIHGKGGNDRISGGGGDDFLDGGGGSRDRLGGGSDLDYCFDGERNSGCEASGRSRATSRSARRSVQTARPARGGTATLPAGIHVLYALAGGKPVSPSLLTDLSGSSLGQAATANADPYTYSPYPTCSGSGRERVAKIAPPQQIRLGERPGEQTLLWRATLKDAKGGVIARTAFARATIQPRDDGWAHQWTDLTSNRPYQPKPFAIRGSAARRWEAEMRIEPAPASTHDVAPPCPLVSRR